MSKQKNDCTFLGPPRLDNKAIFLQGFLRLNLLVSVLLFLQAQPPGSQKISTLLDIQAQHFFLTILSSLINKHACLLFSRKKIHPTRSYLRAFYRQASPNFAYSFIKFEEKIPALFIRELRVCRNLGSYYFFHFHAKIIFIHFHGTC